MSGSDNSITYPGGAFFEELREMYREAFARSTERALQVARELEDSEDSEDSEATATALRTLADCECSYEVLYAETEGATYKQLAYIAHLAGMSREGRRRWYGIAASIPLSQSHAGHIIVRLQELAGLEGEIADLEQAWRESP